MPNSSGALVRVDGIPGVVDLKYRPRRISMFPLSYRDRALLRGMERERRRLIEVEAVKEPKEATRASQTNVTYCSHQCSDHPEVSKPSSGESKKDKSKGKGQGESQSKKGKGPKAKKETDSDGEGESSSEDEDEKVKKGKEKDKGDKSKATKADKGEKGKKGGKQTVGDPTLPYPWSSPNFAKLMGLDGILIGDSKEQASPIKVPTIQERIEQARRDDEEQAFQAIANHTVSNRENVLKWLAGRDAARLNKFAELERELGAMNETAGHRRRVSFPDNTPGIPPRFATPSRAGSDQGSHARHLQNGPKGPILTRYDENGNLCLPDGTKLIIPQAQEFAPATPITPNAQPAHTFPAQRPPVQAQWNHPANAWQNQQMPNQTMQNGNTMQHGGWHQPQQMPDQAVQNGNAAQHGGWHPQQMPNQAMQNSNAVQNGAWQHAQQAPTQAVPNRSPPHNNPPQTTQWGGPPSNDGNVNGQNGGNQEGWGPLTNDHGVPVDPGDEDNVSNGTGWHQQGPNNRNGQQQTTRFNNVQDAFEPSDGNGNGNGRWNHGNNQARGHNSPRQNMRGASHQPTNANPNNDTWW